MSRTAEKYEVTPIEVWGPAFRWLKELTVGATFSDLRCKLCELDVPFPEQEAHVRKHRAERKKWNGRREKEVSRENESRLRAINRERALARRVLPSQEEEVTEMAKGATATPRKRTQSDAPKMTEPQIRARMAELKEKRDLYAADRKAGKAKANRRGAKEYKEYEHLYNTLRRMGKFLGGKPKAPKK